jgi:hypothetical protein
MNGTLAIAPHYERARARFVSYTHTDARQQTYGLFVLLADVHSGSYRRGQMVACDVMLFQADISEDWF